MVKHLSYFHDTHDAHALAQRTSALQVEASGESNTAERVQLLKGWRVSDGAASLAEVHSSIKCPDPSGSTFSKAIAFAGLGGMIAVGYMDPGNWYGTLFSSQKYTVLVA